MNGFEFTEHIARTPDEVFAVISDPGRASAFLENFVGSVQLTDGPVGVGTRFRETRRMRGTEHSTDLEITAYEPPGRVGIQAEAEGIAVEYTYLLTPEGDGTRLVWSCELRASGLRRMMLPMVATIMKKEDGDHLRLLKAHLEQG